jgi:tryptophanyl-tRNA synthetase
MAKNVIFSGIQPSGELHIGNYLGAIQNWISLLDTYDSIFCIVDYHAVTAPYETGELHRRTLEAAMVYIASGLDPERCTIFVQSDVPEHTELQWLLGTVTPIGDLFRMTQYKDKSQTLGAQQSVCSGLLCYPILQAADILLYKAQAVPVGEDQAQHLELTREIARNFNRRFGPVFPEPQTLLSEARRILGVDGEKKMSKSLGNHLGLTEPAGAAWEKLRTAKTDPARVRRRDPGTPEKCNIYAYHTFFTPPGPREECAAGCRTAGIGCVDCKKVLHEHMQAVLEPIRRRFEEIKQEPARVNDVLDRGAERCRAVARQTVREVREAMGIVPRSR